MGLINCDFSTAENLESANPTDLPASYSRNEELESSETVGQDALKTSLRAPHE
jgi:hypothetical protein